MKQGQPQPTVQKIDHCHFIITLLKWMKTKGYKSNKIITPAIFSGCGRGMMAKCNIEKDTCIISIPHCLLITTAVVNRSWLGSILRKNTFHLSPREILSLFLIYEKHRGTDSPWHPYIDTLPRNYTLPVNWKQIPTDLPERFQGVCLNQIRDVQSSYNRVQHVVEFVESERPCFKDVVCLESFVWAWCTVQTRGVHFKEKTSTDENDNYALAPFLDFFNHSPTADVTAKFCEETNNYQITTHQSHSKNSQVFINYGIHDNLHLILNYGFYVSMNTHSSVQFKLSELCDGLSEIKLGNDLDKKLKILQENKLFRDVSCRFGEVSWNFLTCSRILVCSHDELQMQQWTRVFDGSVSTRNEKSSRDLIEKCLNNRLNELSKCVVPSHYDDNNFSLFLIEEERNILISCKLK